MLSLCLLVFRRLKKKKKSISVNSFEDSASVLVFLFYLKFFFDLGDLLKDFFMLLQF